MDFSVLGLDEDLFHKVKSDYRNAMRILRDEPAKAINFENYILTCKHEEGRPIILETNGTPIISASDDWLGYRGVSRDVTQRMQTEAKIAQSEAQYRNVVETSNDVVFISDKKGQFRFLNSANEKVLGYKLADLYKMNGLELIHPEDLANVQHQLNQFYDGNSMTNIEYRFRAQSGRYVPFRTNFSPIYNNTGEVDAFLGVARDVTELVKKERELRERELNLQYANVMSMVSSILIHDNPGTKMDISSILRTLGNSIRADYIFVLEKAPKNSSPSSVSYNIMEVWQKSSAHQLDISVLEPQIVAHFDFLDLQGRPQDVYRSIKSSDFSPDVEVLMKHLNFYHMLEVPIYLENTLHGHLLLVSTQKDYEFHPHSIKLSLNVAMLIGFGLQRAESTELSQILFQTLNSLDISVFIMEILPTGGNQIIYVNDRYCQFYGYSREEIMALKDYSVLIPSSEQHLIDKLEFSPDGSGTRSQIYPLTLNTRNEIKDVLFSVSYGTLKEKRIIFGYVIDDLSQIHLKSTPDRDRE